MNIFENTFGVEPEYGLRICSFISLAFAWCSDLGAVVPTYNTPLCFFAVLCSALNQGFPIALLTVLLPTSIIFDILWCADTSTTSWVTTFLIFLIISKFGLFFFSFRCMARRGVTFSSMLRVEVPKSSSDYSEVLDVTENNYDSRTQGVDL